MRKEAIGRTWALALLATIGAAVPGITLAADPICGDVNASGGVTASDALAVLKEAVGQNVSLDCGSGCCAPAASVGVAHHYVINSLMVPTSPLQANAFAFNLDNDSQNHPDNAFGAFLASIADPAIAGFDIEGAVNGATLSGATVELASLRANNLATEALASWRFFVGRPTSSPPLMDGSDVFTVAPNGAMQGDLDGKITSGHLAAQVVTGSLARLPISIALVPGQPPIELDLIGAHVAVDVTPTGCTNGRVGGGVKNTDLDSGFIPAWAAAIEAIIPSDCRAGAAVGDYSLCDSASKGYLQVFDKSPKDGHITVDEVRNNVFLQTLLTPDVDLLGGNGGYDPTPADSPTAAPDSISVAFGFSCVSATFTE